MYLSDERRTMRVLPWALDELEMPDRYLLAADESRFDAAHETRSSLIASRDEGATDDAYARGRADGERAMRAAFESSMSTVFAALTDAVERVRIHEAPWTANAEENLAAMAVVIARHIVEREVTADAQIVTDLVQRALAQFPLDQAISVRLHPDDLAACDAVLASGMSSRSRDVRLVADPYVQRGGCLVEGRERVIDGRVDTSLERAYRSLGQLQA